MSRSENGIPSSTFALTSTGGNPFFFRSFASFLSFFACFFASLVPARSRRPVFPRPACSGGVALSNWKEPVMSMECGELGSILISRFSSSAYRRY